LTTGNCSGSVQCASCECRPAAAGPAPVISYFERFMARFPDVWYVAVALIRRGALKVLAAAGLAD